jgi:hypothetical protein
MAMKTTDATVTIPEIVPKPWSRLAIACSLWTAVWLVGCILDFFLIVNANVWPVSSGGISWWNAWSGPLILGLLLLNLLLANILVENVVKHSSEYGCELVELVNYLVLYAIAFFALGVISAVHPGS